jgi:hypothetical protein
MFDQQPVGSLAAGPVVLDADQHPASLEMRALKLEFQIAVRESLLGRVSTLGRPIAAIPELNRAAAVLAFRDRPLEIAIGERMVFHLDRQPLLPRVERGSASHGPRLEDAVELRPQIIVQTAGVVLLHHEPPARRGPGTAFVAGLRRFGEIPLGGVFRKFLKTVHEPTGCERHIFA